jgi:hypothetical protein
MFGNRDIELAQDSPTASRDDGEVISPLAGGRMSPNRPAAKHEAKVMMMSTTDRESLSSRGNSMRTPIIRKKQSWEKTCKTYGSLCMAIFLFAGGLVSITYVTV